MSGFGTPEFADVPAGGSEIDEFAPSLSGISVFEFGGCENGENARTVGQFCGFEGGGVHCGSLRLLEWVSKFKD